MNYGAAELVADNLNEKPMLDKAKVENIVFSGSPRPPWNTYVGDGGNCRKRSAASRPALTMAS